MSLLDFFRKKKPAPPEPLPSARCMILSRLQEPPDDDTVRNAFLMRNKLNDENAEPGLYSLSKLLLSDDLQCYLPHYIAQRAP